MTAYAYDHVDQAERLREKAAIEFRWKELAEEEKALLQRLAEIEREREDLELEARSYNLDLSEV